MSTAPGPVCIKNSMHSSMLLCCAEKTPNERASLSELHTVTNELLLQLITPNVCFMHG